MLRCHDNGNVGVHVCAEFHDHTFTHTQCFMLIVKYTVICSYRLRLVAIGYEYGTLP